MSGGRFLARWSRLKRTAESAPPAPEKEPVAAPPADAASRAEAETAPLPAPESLTLESDFTAFLKEEVGEAVRRQALKKLFNDPHFNVMDGLDIYIDDYSVPAPIPPDVLARLRHAQEFLAGAEDEGEVAADPARPVEPPAVPAPDVVAAEEADAAAAVPSAVQPPAAGAVSEET